MAPVIWWIRRDLRIQDNSALASAAFSGEVLPVFILDRNLLDKAAPVRRAFLFAGLEALKRDIENMGGNLVVRDGNPEEVFWVLMRETGASRIYAEEDYSPYAQRRDRKIMKAFPLELVLGSTVFHPESVRKSDGAPYSVFTPYCKAWKSLPLPKASTGIIPRFYSLKPPERGNIPDAQQAVDFQAGEQEALNRLDNFLAEFIHAYHQERNRMDLASTSQLSPYIRFGMLSMRMVVARVLHAIEQAADADSRQGCETWLNELIWREFYNHVLYHYPSVLKQAYQPRMRKIKWRIAPAELDAWQEGLTGYPIVDAGMRQLKETGWMHNRARMITASFLTKDLLINWQEGERWFMKHLVDGDPASNNGGWQWTAGVGLDAAPYFRIFNPIVQGTKYDPHGDYVRRWVPELASVPTNLIHTPWLMSVEEQSAAGCIMGRDYPEPIVNHKEVKIRTMKAYQSQES